MTENLDAVATTLPRIATDRRDQISVTGIGAVGYHGVFENERRVGQPFFVDVTLFSDCAAAGASDDLNDTINYGAVAETVKEAIVGEPVNLIEALAERIVRLIFERFGVQAVEITVHKPKAPIEVTFADVALTIYRENT